MLTNSIILDLLLLIFLAIVLAFISLRILEKYNAYKASKTKANKSRTCEQKKRAVLKELKKDFRWLTPAYYSHRTLFITFILALGLALGYTLSGVASIITLLISFLAFIGLLVFLYMAYTRYTQATSLVKKRLDIFEEQLQKSLESAIAFQGDKIQSFSKEDEEFDTDPKSFSFVVKKTEKSFPKFWNSKAPKFIVEQKKEFLVLSSDYFNIFQNASTFDLLNPKFKPETDKKAPCELAPAGVGEGIEHYYSQMKSVEYNTAEKAIIIHYYNDEQPVKFVCKKDAAAIKALQEKLRMTERQRLRKIDEHEKYEEIKTRRKSTITEEQKEEESKENNSSDS